MDETFDPVQAAAVTGLYFTRVPGNCHVNARQLVGGWRVDGEEAIAAKGAEIVERALAGKAHDEIGGGDVAFEADEFDAAVPESGEGKPDLVDEGSVVAVESRLHALDRAGTRSPKRFFKGDGIGAGAQGNVTLRAGRHPISTGDMLVRHANELRRLLKPIGCLPKWLLVGIS